MDSNLFLTSVLYRILKISITADILNHRQEGESSSVYVVG